MSDVKYPELGERFKQARKRAGLSHDTLGALAGTSRQHLINLEKGRHRPGDEMLARIAAATNRPVEFFSEALREEQEASDEDEESDLAMLGALVLRLIEKRTRAAA